MDLNAFIQSPAGKALLTAGAAGVVTGTAGGLFSSMEKRPLEQKSKRRNRILRNALGAGVAGAGAVGLLHAGLNQINSVLPVSEPTRMGAVLEHTLPPVGLLGATHVTNTFLDRRGLIGKLEGIIGEASKKSPELGDLLKGDSKYLYHRLKASPEAIKILQQTHKQPLLDLGIGNFFDRTKNRLFGGNTLGNVTNPLVGREKLLEKARLSPAQAARLSTQFRIPVKGNALLTGLSLAAIPTINALGNNAD